MAREISCYNLIQALLEVNQAYEEALSFAVNDMRSPDSCVRTSALEIFLQLIRHGHGHKEAIAAASQADVSVHVHDKALNLWKELFFIGYGRKEAEAVIDRDIESSDPIKQRLAKDLLKMMNPAPARPR